MKSIVLFLVLTLILGVGISFYNKNVVINARESASEIKVEAEKAVEMLEMEPIKMLEIEN